MLTKILSFMPHSQIKESIKKTYFFCRKLISTACLMDFIRDNKNKSITIEMNMFSFLRQRCRVDRDRRDLSFYLHSQQSL